jgi:hypothetical protein
MLRSGGCTIQFDKNLDIILEADTENGVVQMYIVIAQAPATNRENFFAALLQLHLFGVATNGTFFGFDPQLNRVLFLKRCLCFCWMLTVRSNKWKLLSIRPSVGGTGYQRWSLRWRPSLRSRLFCRLIASKK